MTVSGWWVPIAFVGWSLALLYFGWYQTEKWYARECLKLRHDAVKHWDETREALHDALHIAPSLLTRSRDKEFKS